MFSRVQKFLSRTDYFKPQVDKKEVDLYVWLKDAAKLYESTEKMLEKEKNRIKVQKENPDWE